MREYTGRICVHCGFDPDTYEPTPTALLPMTLLHNRYLLGDVLGKGGFGITYIGYDNVSCRRIAVKEYYPTQVVSRDGSRTKEISVPDDLKQVYEAGVSKFYNEAVTLSKLRDIPAIVDIYDFFCENNTAYIVMEYIDGTAVDKIVMNQGGLDIDVVLTIYYPIILTLQKVHRAGILHRDISPSNVMLDGKYRARLIDFGASRAYSHEMSTDLTVLLKKGFAPFEQYSRKGKHGPAEDVYAICASMYYTLTGKVPPAAPDRRVFDTLQPVRNFGTDLPEAIDRIILKGMAVHAEDRYPDMEALAAAIDAAVGTGENGRRSAPEVPGSGRIGTRKGLLDGIAGRISLPAVLLAGTAVLFLILLVILFQIL